MTGPQELPVSAHGNGKVPLQCRSHGIMADWLRQLNGSLAVTTYNSGKLVFVSALGRRLLFRSRKLVRPMGLAVNGRRLAVATRERILLFSLSQENHGEGQAASTNSCVYLPKCAYRTGKVNAHDLAFSRRGLMFANTRFNSIARVSEQKKFISCWQPSFISSKIAEDHCHLNGIGLRHGQLAMATAFCATNQRGDWRKENRFTSGVLVDVQQDRIVAQGLCMPHSPRCYRGKWLLCNSGFGSLSMLDASTGTCREVCALPGFTRGLCFVGGYALVGLSKIRPAHILDAPPVRERHNELFAGVALVELKSGKLAGLLEFETGGNEVFEVAFLPRVKRPDLVPFDR